MDFNLDEEYRILKETVRKFCETEWAPIAAKVDGAEDFPDEQWNKLKELGLLGMGIPEEYGGSFRDYLSMAVTSLEMGRVEAGIATSFGAHALLCANNIARNATDTQKAEYLPSLANGECIGCLAITEPSAGSDAMSLKTTARKDGDSYVISGTKTFITNAPIADIALVYATVDPALGARGICGFIVEKGFPGYSAGKKFEKMGLRASPTGEIVLDECRVPAKNLLGGVEGRGSAHMLKGLDIERAMWSAIAIGIARRAFEYSRTYVLDRVQFGQPLINFQMVQDKLATMATSLEASELLLNKTIWLIDREEDSRMLASYLKLFACEMVNLVTADAVHLHGGYGYMREFPVEKLMRDAKVFAIGAGTSEVQKMIIAHYLH